MLISQRCLAHHEKDEARDITDSQCTVSESDPSDASRVYDTRRSLTHIARCLEGVLAMQ